MISFFFLNDLGHFTRVESPSFFKGTLGLQPHHNELNGFRIHSLHPMGSPSACTHISHLRANNCLRSASLASFPCTFTVSALKAHLIPRILKGSGSLGAMFSQAILGEWEGIWIRNFP